MDRAGNSKKGPAGPTLFRQIATRLAAFTLLFALLDVAIVVFTYSSQPESLAQELLTLEASKAANGTTLAPDLLAGPPGAEHWSARYIEPQVDGPTTAPYRANATPGVLMDWTRRERVAGGYRISGVRSVIQEGQQRWLFMQFEGDGIRPYVPVIVNEIVQHVLLPLIPLSLLLLLFNIFAVRQVLRPLKRAESEVDALDPDNRLPGPPGRTAVAGDQRQQPVQHHGLCRYRRCHHADIGCGARPHPPRPDGHRVGSGVLLTINMPRSPATGQTCQRGQLRSALLSRNFQSVARSVATWPQFTPAGSSTLCLSVAQSW